METKTGVPLSVKQNTEQFFKFTLFSISAGIVQIASFTMLNELTPFMYWPSYLIALILSVLYNFTVNRRFTFKSATNIPIANVESDRLLLCIYSPVNLVGRLLNKNWMGLLFCSCRNYDYQFCNGVFILPLCGVSKLYQYKRVRTEGERKNRAINQYFSNCLQHYIYNTLLIRVTLSG